ncbi:uncharacterized protein LOC125663078 [Ostrea edulis]|uniref:uncharacterized protein LOC125663078 n=1 Tax=Ostrea edulis TaxID=37623 RepID=UPI0024AF6CAB|nr:uncharacterized protein LOC125663078 [Ostrea edulis]
MWVDDAYKSIDERHACTIPPSISDMAPVSVLGCVIITAILGRATTARLVRGNSETIETDPHEDERPCIASVVACMKPKVDEVYVQPVTKSDGSLYFPADYFTSMCGYFTLISDCYGKVKSTTCEPGFPNRIIKNSGKMSLKLCKNADALNTLVPCLNDKGVFEAYRRAVKSVRGEKESSCNEAREIIRRALRLFKGMCGEAEYTTLKTVLENFGDDLLVLFENTEGQGCSIDIDTLTPDTRRRGVASATMKRMMDVWVS